MAISYVAEAEVAERESEPLSNNRSPKRSYPVSSIVIDWNVMFVPSSLSEVFWVTPAGNTNWSPAPGASAGWLPPTRQFSVFDQPFASSPAAPVQV